MRLARSILWTCSVLATTLGAAAPAHAFIYPEHRDIGVTALSTLSASERDVLRGLWTEARPQLAGPVCRELTMGIPEQAPSCIDFPALSAIAGDHSCSPLDVSRNVLPSSWVLGVARVAEDTKTALAKSTSADAIYNHSATMNLRLQDVDPGYLSRAGANSAHFLLARTGNDLDAYLRLAASRGAPTNSLGLYLHYHLAALALAQELATQSPAEGHRAVMARDILLLESFALHWLQDMFASGHATGTWGSDPWRKGTHDHYNEHGLDMTTWGGERMVAFGDSHMRDDDRNRAAAIEAASLRQLVAALEPGDPLAQAARSFGAGVDAAYRLDSCRAERQPEARDLDALTHSPSLRALLLQLPMPGRGPDDVHIPRFRQEFGPFVGAFGTVAGALNWGTLGTHGMRPSIELAAGARVGYAAPAITGTVGTSKTFLDTGLVMQSPQRQSCDDELCNESVAARLLPRVPSRVGLRIGVRVPFYVVPGDLLVLAPLLLATSPRTLTQVGVAAMQGGLIPYERSFRTPAGFFQVVAGREAELTLFGYLTESLEVRNIGSEADPVGGVTATRSMRVRLPLVEWTPLRNFATNVTFALPLQAGFGFEVPLASSVLLPEGASASAPGVGWHAFVRVQLDAHYFFGEREDLR